MVGNVWRTQLHYKANSLVCNLHGPVLLYQDLFLGVQPGWFLPGLLLETDVPPSQLYISLTNLRLTPYALPNLSLLYLWHSLVPFALVAKGGSGQGCSRH